MKYKWFSRLDHRGPQNIHKEYSSKLQYFNTCRPIHVKLTHETYVDYLFLTGKENLISGCKKNLAKKFEMKDLGMMHYFLGLEVWPFPDEIFLNQGKYGVEILKRFRMLDCKAMNTPMVTNP